MIMATDMEKVGWLMASFAVISGVINAVIAMVYGFTIFTIAGFVLTFVGIIVAIMVADG